MTAATSPPSQGVPGEKPQQGSSSEHEMSPEVYRAIGELLKEQSGFSLECYKDKCVKRRIGIRIRATQAPSPEAYRDLLTSDSDELERLLRVLTIHVSHFFRNPTTFAKLAREILPPLFKRRADGDELSFLSVGCAGGEEPYSLALIMKERFAAEMARLRVSIRGLDVDAATLVTAAEGCYGPERLAELKERQLARWFTPVGARFQLAREIRDLVSFSRADLNDDGAFEKSDLILCRNVLIYIERKRQEAILMRFADALAGGGVLVLGKSETLVGAARRRFQTVCPVERIYRVP